MERIYSEGDITWSSIERHYDYSKVRWNTQKNGIPIYALFDEDDNKIDISVNIL